MSGDPLPTVPESEASGGVAEIYGDIRHALGGTVVNLIWRHFATVPGGLAWAWYTVRPAYVGGALRAAAAELGAAVRVPPVERITSDELRAAGVTADDETTVRRILDTYQRGNELNLVGLSALALAATGERGEGAAPTIPPPPALGAVPPILDPADLDARTVATMYALNRLGAIGEEPMLGSLYRHLAYWPGLLELWLQRLGSLHESGRLDALREEVFAVAQTRARAVLGALGTPPAVDEASREAVLHAIERFRRPMIARMVGLGRLMSATLPAPDEP